MTHVVVMGAGLGGLPMAYEMEELLRPEDNITLVGLGDTYDFVPSNPWVAVHWRRRKDIEFPIAPYLEKKGIAFDGRGVKRVHPAENRLELNDGANINYD